MQTNQFNASDKILHYMEKINLFLSIGKTLVVTELDLTNHCNNRCPACIGRNAGGDALTWDEIVQIAYGLQELDCKGVILSGGGEPLLHPKFIQTLKLLKETGLHIGVNTNGLALNEKIAAVIADTCEYCRISLDCGDGNLYKKTHGMNEEALSCVLKNIRFLSRIKREKNARLRLGTGFLTSKETLYQMEMFVKLSKT